MKSPTLTVQYRPYVLILARNTSSGAWTAELRRIGEEPGAAALVFATTTGLDESLGARVNLDAAMPALWIGTAAFEMPRKQLARVKAWIDEQRAPLPVAAAPADPEAPAP